MTPGAVSDPRRGWVAAGDFVYVTNDYQSFSQWFGFPPDFATPKLNLDGNDAVLLFVRFFPLHFDIPVLYSAIFSSCQRKDAKRCPLLLPSTLHAPF
jgi:hypothetical protein